MEDEIICNACGRPNLKRAERCWFCQSLLEKDATRAEQNKAIEEEIEAVEQDIESRKARVVHIQEAPVPDWLKKVRELAKADMPPEERAKWEQEHLFGDSIAKQPRKSVREKTAQPSKVTSQTEKVAVKQEEAMKVEQIDGSITDDDEEDPTENVNEGPLPDGFKPLH